MSSAKWLEKLRYIQPKKTKRDETGNFIYEGLDPILIAADFETSIITDSEDSSVMKHSVIGWSISSKPDIMKNQTGSIYRLITDTNHIKISDVSEDELILQLWQVLITIRKRHRTNIYVYMHNLGAFDGILLISSLERLGILKDSNQVIMRNSSIYEVHISGVVFRDSYKLLPGSLKKLGTELVNMKKGDLDLDWLKTLNAIRYNSTKIVEYMVQDSTILYELIKKSNMTIQKNFGVNISECRTVSTLSYTIYRKLYLEGGELIANSSLFNDNIQQILRQSYRGGIVEVYKPEGYNLYQYDINSAYPNAMKNDMPIGLPKRINNSELEHLNIQQFFGFLVVKINVAYNYIPFIGIKNQKAASNIYPYGTFKISIFSEELKYAMTVNDITILSIYTAVEFGRGDLFTHFVDDVYKLRNQSQTSIEKKIYKNVLNSLYGRMGLKNEIDQISYMTEHELKLMEILTETRRVGNTNLHTSSTENVTMNEHMIDNMALSDTTKEELRKLQKRIQKQKKYTQTAIHIASAITAYARINIDRHKRTIMNSNGNIYYSDTDSLVTDTQLPTSTKMGELKLERSIKWAYHISPKAYIHVERDNKITTRFKGINTEELKKIIGTDEKSIKKFTELIKKNKQINTTYLYDTPIKKDLKSMRILSTKKRFKPTMIIKKRTKVINNEGAWQDTEPINYQKWE